MIIMLSKCIFSLCHWYWSRYGNSHLCSKLKRSKLTRYIMLLNQFHFSRSYCVYLLCHRGFAGFFWSYVADFYRLGEFTVFVILSYHDVSVDYCNGYTCTCHVYGRAELLGVPYITVNIYCKSRNLPNTDIHNYSIYLR